MTKEVEIEALRPFNRTAQGEICSPGDRFPVGEVRAGELERLGLARPTGKAAPAPKNKMAPEPDNKVLQGDAAANPGVRAAAVRERVGRRTVAQELP